VQIERILKINGLSFITDDVVEAARSTLVISASHSAEETPPLISEGHTVKGKPNARKS
jgi:hypothetical protein